MDNHMQATLKHNQMLIPITHVCNTTLHMLIEEFYSLNDVDRKPLSRFVSSMSALLLAFVFQHPRVKDADIPDFDELVDELDSSLEGFSEAFARTSNTRGMDLVRAFVRLNKTRERLEQLRKLIDLEEIIIETKNHRLGDDILATLNEYGWKLQFYKVEIV